MEEINLLLRTIDAYRREIDVLTTAECVNALRKIEAKLKELEELKKVEK